MEQEFILCSLSKLAAINLLMMLHNKEPTLDAKMLHSKNNGTKDLPHK